MITRVNSRIFTNSTYDFEIFHENSHFRNYHLQKISEIHI